MQSNPRIVVNLLVIRVTTLVNLLVKTNQIRSPEPFLGGCTLEPTVLRGSELGTCQTADGWLVDPATKGWPQGPNGPPLSGAGIHSRSRRAILPTFRTFLGELDSSTPRV